MQVLEIHTSDRILFKRCRRKWNWQSPTRANLTNSTENPAPLWLGSGVHFALEDYHGYRHFPTPQAALESYARCFPSEQLPYEHKDLVTLGSGMLTQYCEWEARHSEFETVWIGDTPLCEVNFRIPLLQFFTPERAVYYVGTLDRIVRDPYGRFWIVDYKTAARVDTGKLDTDCQITSYSWAGDALFGPQYGMEFEGVVYIQLAKSVPDAPIVLKSTGLPSLNKQQNTTYYIYREALLGHYPDGKFPPQYVEFLNYLAGLETPEGNKFVRRDLVRRTRAQKAAEYQKIILETTDMLNPDLPLYPNPTKDCSWDCIFREVCIAMDDAADWESMITDDTYVPKRDLSDWRSRLVFPGPYGPGE